MPTLYDAIVAWADQWPDKLAVITESDGTRTFGELAQRSARLAHGLVHELGYAVGDRACVWMSNRPEWVDTLVAVHAAGVASVPANPDWSDAELGYVLEHSGCRAIVCEAEQAGRALALRDRIDSLEHVVVVGDGPAGSLPFEALIEGAPVDSRPGLPEVPAAAEGSLLYTSGTTTGRPKGVVMSAEMLTTGVSYEEIFGVSHTDRSIFVTPLFHGNGLGGCTSAISRGASAVFPRRFSAAGFWALVDRYRPTYLFTLAPIVNILMTLPPSPLERSHSLRVLIVLGAAANAEAIEERYGVPVIDWYGMTEAGMGTYTRLGEPRRPGSAGRVFEGSDMRILRDDGSEAGPGEVGEVAFRASALGFTGYLQDPEATESAMDGDWFRTGDLGRMDEDGYFLAGRAAPTVEALRIHAEGKLAGFKLPEEVYAVDDLPRTGTGKVEKFRLRQQLAG